MLRVLQPHRAMPIGTNVVGQTQTDSIERYFWFIGGAFAMLNVVVWRGRLRPVVALGRVTQQEADAFLRGAAISIAVAAATLAGC